MHVRGSLASKANVPPLQVCCKWLASASNVRPDATHGGRSSNSRLAGGELRVTPEGNSSAWPLSKATCTSAPAVLHVLGSRSSKANCTSAPQVLPVACIASKVRPDATHGGRTSYSRLRQRRAPGHPGRLQEFEPRVCMVGPVALARQLIPPLRPRACKSVVRALARQRIPPLHVCCMSLAQARMPPMVEAHPTPVRHTEGSGSPRKAVCKLSKAL